jgi:hypothetical protein
MIVTGLKPFVKIKPDFSLTRIILGILTNWINLTYPKLIV